MNLLQTVDLYFGGPGSGCDPEAAKANGTTCGRPSKDGTTSDQKRAGGRLADGKHIRYNKDKKAWEHMDGSSLPDHMAKIRIPPAWEDTRYNPDPDGDVMAAGFDAKGRSVAIYSAKFKANNADAKFARVAELDKKFESIMSQVSKDLEGPASEEAQVLRLIATTGIRPGGEGDTGAEKQAYGATTLKASHIKGNAPDGVRLKFTGKKGVALSIKVTDRRVAEELLRRRDSAANPRAKIFDVSSNELLRYVDTLDGGGFKTKDFRTLVGTREAMSLVSKVKKPPTNEKEYKKAVRAVAKSVAEKLGNTPTIALQSYINPVVFSQWRLA